MSWFTKENPNETKKVEPKASLSALLAASLNSTHPHLSPNTVEQTASPAAIEIPIEKKPEPEVLEKPTEIAVVEENLPAVQETNKVVLETKQVAETEIPNTPELNVETHPEIKQNEKLVGRELVNDFLDELNKLMLAGQELNTFSEARATLSEESKVKLDELNAQLADSKKIKSAVEILLSKANNENVQTKMLDSVKSIEIAIDSLVEQLQNEEGSARKSDSALLIQLNGQKTSINKLMEMIGGKNKFDTLRDYVKKSEYVAERHLSKKFNEDFQNQPKAREVIVDAILETINFVRTDTHIAKEMVSNGDLMSILLATFQNKAQK